MKIGDKIEWYDGGDGTIIAVDTTTVPTSYRVREEATQRVYYLYSEDEGIVWRKKCSKSET